MKRHTFRQRDIYWVDLNPTRGVETQKKRPCVLLQSDMINKGSKSFIIAPLLPEHKQWPFVVNLIPSDVNNLDKKRHINLKQLRAVDFSRISNKYGEIEDFYMSEIEEVIEVIFGMI